MKRVLLSGALLFLLFQQAVQACTCADICEEAFSLDKNSNEVCTKKYLEIAHAVFYGKVVEVTEPSTEFMTYRIKFKVKTAWKFVETSEIFIYASKDEGSNCGVDFEVGKSYLVWAEKNRKRYYPAGELYTDSCLMWRLDRKSLGDGYKPKKKRIEKSL